MAKEMFNRSVAHKNIGEIEAGNNIGGSTIGFWNQVSNNIANNVEDGYADYKKVDATPEERLAIQS